MKLYMHPVSTASRPVMMFVTEAKIACEPVIVDLMKGEHYQPHFSKLNPSRQVPVLEDGDFVLTESSAILKYLADKVNSPLYPKDLQQRARVNERMDWFNTGFYREYGYNLVYPQLFAHHKRPTDDIHAGVVQWGKEKANVWLKILDQDILGKSPYVCGQQMTIADILGGQFVALGETVKADFAPYPNVQGWLSRMKALPSWRKNNEAFEGFVGSLRDKAMVAP